MDNLEIRFRWTCPHCGFVNGGMALISSQYQTVDEIVCCDVHAGGCEQRLVLSTSIKVETKVYKLDAVEDKEDE